MVSVYHTSIVYLQDKLLNTIDCLGACLVKSGNNLVGLVILFRISYIRDDEVLLFGL